MVWRCIGEDIADDSVLNWNNKRYLELNDSRSMLDQRFLKGIRKEILHGEDSPDWYCMGG